MHGQKGPRKRSLRGAFQIEGNPLIWELTSEPQSTTEGQRGLRVSVKLAEEVRRELIIEYPYDKSVFHPQRPKITPSIIEASAREAMVEGWDPLSRGRSFLFKASTKLETGQQPAGSLSSYRSVPSSRRRS